VNKKRLELCDLSGWITHQSNAIMDIAQVDIRRITHVRLQLLVFTQVLKINCRK